MNLHLTDREKQTATAALESLRQRKQKDIETSAQYTKDHPIAKEIRKPENQYDILSCEHTLMHAITLLAKLTGQPIAHFANPNPSQLPQPKTHTTEGPGPVPTPNQKRANSTEEAEAFFRENSEGCILCVDPAGGAMECHSYPDAKAFFAAAVK